MWVHVRPSVHVMNPLNPPQIYSLKRDVRLDKRYGRCCCCFCCCCCCCCWWRCRRRPGCWWRSTFCDPLCPPDGERSPSSGSVRSDWSEEALKAKANDAKAQKVRFKVNQKRKRANKEDESNSFYVLVRVEWSDGTSGTERWLFSPTLIHAGGQKEPPS